MRVVYVLPETSRKSPNACTARASYLLPALESSVELAVFAFGEADASQLSAHMISHVPCRHNPVRLLWASIFSILPRVFARYKSKRIASEFRKICMEFQPDIVHFDSLSTLALFTLAQGLSRELDFSIVVHPHDSITRLTMRRMRSEKSLVRKLDLWLQMIKIKRIERRYYREADLCLVDSSEDAAYLRKLNPHSRVEVLPLGFNEDIFSPDGFRESLRHPAIVFSGSMRSSQSVDGARYLVSEIMPVVWRNYPAAVVYLVGAGPGEHLFDLQREQTGRVVVTGFVESVAAYLRSADVYVSPLRLGSGMRTRVIEAAACGCAIVSSRAGIVGLDIGNEKAPWLIAENAADFGASVLAVLADKNLRDDLGEQARQLSEQKYTWRMVASALTDYYVKVAPQAEAPLIEGESKEKCDHI
ncbi:MAG: glycosyltransferase family 4 protein [Gammaproteobacteria bacterium]